MSTDLSVAHAEQHLLRKAEIAELKDQLRRHRRLLVKLLMFALPVGVLLAFSAAFVAYFAADLWLTQHLQRISLPWFRELMVVVSWPGYSIQPFVIIAVIALLLLALGRRTESGFLLLSVSGGQIVCDLIKVIIHRPRPSASLIQVISVAHGYSFPSGHVFHYMSFYGLLFYLVFILIPRSGRRSALLLLLGTIVALIGISRMYLGDHWASDVFGAYLFGAIWLSFVVYLYWRFKLRRVSAIAAREALNPGG